MFARKRLMMIGLPVLLGGLAGAPVFAQTTDSGNAPAVDTPAQNAQPPHHHWSFDPSARVQKHLDKLKAALKIAPEQEPQWSAFSDKVMAQVQQMKAEHNSAQVRPTTAPERIDWQLARMKERTQRFEVVAAAAKDLYAVLTPEQKQVADKRLLRFHHHHRA